MAEAHPVGFQWVMEAKKRGATIIHVDPRFTRTSAVSDVHVPIRAGTDIAFLGGLVHHILENDLDFREYVVAYTNASHILREDFADTEDLEGVFSGWDPETKKYDATTWQYENAFEQAPAGSGVPEQPGTLGNELGKGVPGPQGRSSQAPPRPLRDETLQHPRCVWQVLKRHFARYTPETVHEITGIAPEQVVQVAETLAANSGRERTSAICYAVGWTHHSVGSQMIRTSAILQLLLGNIGRPGGGIMALRGHASIQGSTDIPTLFHILPGYIPMPSAHRHQDLDAFVAADAGKTGFWGNMRSYMVSMLKAWFEDAATADNDWGFDLIPKIDGDHGTYTTVMNQIQGKTGGYFLVGENPAVGSANAKLHRMGMANLDWLVVRDLQMIESATFWKNGPEIETGELRTEDIATEVFFLPAASHVEKEGTFTNTQRLLQWRHKAVEPPGDARSDLWFYWHLGNKLKERVQGSTDPRDRALQALTWGYGGDERAADGTVEPDGEKVLREINGTGADGKALSSYTELKDDGSTRCGCWIYCGVFADEVNQSARRKPGSEQSWVAPEWGWAWPSNRRIIYNRASADPDGKPWSERKAYVWWDEEQGKWVGHDNADFEATKPPSYRAPEGATGPAGINGDDPFILQTDGKGWLFAPAGLADGPLPTHYEPFESPVRNVLYPQQQANPAREFLQGGHLDNQVNPSQSEVFPFVFTSYRLTEHHTAGGMSRTLPYLSELQPEMFCEVSPTLARIRGLENLGWATITTARGVIETRVLVTDRVRPLRVGATVVHQVGLPWHWGQNGLSTGDAQNDLVGIVMDPNVHIQDKVGTCDIRPGRRPRGPAVLEHVKRYRRMAGLETEAHPPGPQDSTPDHSDGHPTRDARSGGGE